MSRAVLRGNGAERRTGPCPGIAILGTFRADHSMTLPTVGSGPALHSSYRARKAQSENQSDSVRGSLCTSVTYGQKCLFLPSVLQLEAEPPQPPWSHLGVKLSARSHASTEASSSIPNTDLSTKASHWLEDNCGTMKQPPWFFVTDRFSASIFFLVGAQ